MNLQFYYKLQSVIIGTKIRIIAILGVLLISISVFGSEAELASKSVPLKDMFDEKYSTSIEKSIEALLIQTGFQTSVSNAKSLVESRFRETIGQSSLAKPFLVLTFGYKVFREKEVSFPISRTKRLTLRANRSLNFTMDF